MANLSIEIAERLVKEELADIQAKTLVDTLLGESTLNKDMANLRVASRYAKALLGLASERNELKAVEADLKHVGELISSSREFELLLEVGCKTRSKASRT